MINGYYNRHDPAKEYDEHLFRVGYVIQGAELNEIQAALAYRTKSIGDALFKDGDVIRDCRVVVNASTGAVQCESGAIYLFGAVRGIPPATFTVATTGEVAIGVYLTITAVTEVDDPSLRDPASLTRNYQEPGAGRKKVSAKWGFDGDGQIGEFYPIYSILDGQMLAKEAPPNMDVVAQSLARYDRDSAGGTYVVSGLQVQRLTDLADGRQVYTLAEGRARVNGYGVDQAAARRLVYDAAPDLRLISNEPHSSTTAGSQRIELDRWPVNDVQEVSITAQKTVTLTHGGYVGVQDPLPDTSVLEIIEVKQGGTTFVASTDYKLTAGKVDWSLTGAEPATGSSYSVTYRHIKTVTPTAVDAKGFTVTGAVAGTLVLVTYNQKLPRIDRLAMSSSGDVVWLKGVSADWNPQPPYVSDNLLTLATVYQTWSDDYSLVNDAVRVVPMQDLAQLNGRIDYVIGLVAQQRLEGSANLLEAGQKRGVFVDPFLDDSLRDAGLDQTGAIIDGELTLPVEFLDAARPTADVRDPAFLAYATQPYVIKQTARTGSMKVNPYMAFTPIPALVKLYPSVDRWTETQTRWASAVTRSITTSSWGLLTRQSTQVSTQVLSSTNTLIANLRQIWVEFRLDGFGPGETLSSVTFDGVTITPSAL